MDRRTFLKTGATVLGGIALTPLINACNVAPVAGPVVATAARTIMDYLIELAALTASMVITDDLRTTMNGLGADQRACLDATNQGLAARGFSDYSRTQVFLNDPVFYYGIGHQDGFNACAPIFIADNFCATIEGPAVAGLAYAAREWAGTDGFTAAQGLIPLQTIQNGDLQFQVSSTVPSVYRTHAGCVAMSYVARPQESAGTISVVAARDNGGILLGRNYDLQLA